MNNIRGLAIVTDGSYKRIAITYDTLTNDGVASEPNKKINRIVVDNEINEHIAAIEKYAQQIVDSEES